MRSSDVKHFVAFRWCFTHPLRAILLAIITAVVFFYAGLKWIEFTGRRRLAAVIAETEREWPRWTIEQLEAGRPKIPDDENSALVIAEADKLYRSISPSLYLLDLDLQHPDGLNRRHPDNKLAEIEAAIAPYKPVYEKLLKLKGMPRGHWPVHHEANSFDTNDDHVGVIQNCSWVLLDTAEADLHRGRTSKALDAMASLFNLGDSLREEPLEFSPSSRFHMHERALWILHRYLAMSWSNERELRSILSMVDAHHDRSALRDDLECIRAARHTVFNDIEVHGILPSNTLGDPPFSPKQLKHIYWYFIFSDHATYLAHMNQAVKLAELPSHEQVRALRQLAEATEREALLGPYFYRNVFTMQLRADLPALAVRTLRMHAHMELARIAIAAEHFYLDQGRWPHALVDLVPEYLAQVPVDPLSGQSFLWIAHPSGRIVYSPGIDGRDDRGQPETWYVRYGEASDDLSFWLYDRDQRGLPAKVVMP